jgi:hypothetical protein
VHAKLSAYIYVKWMYTIAVCELTFFGTYVGSIVSDCSVTGVFIEHTYEWIIQQHSRNATLSIATIVQE